MYTWSSDSSGLFGTTTPGQWIPDSSNPWTPGNPLGLDYYYTTVNDTWHVSASGILTIEVAADAPPGEYNLPYVVIHNLFVNAVILQPSWIQVKDSRVCNINPPALIDFGRVDVSGGTLNEHLASATADLTVTCNDATPVSARVIFTGSEDPYWLRLRNNDGDAPGYIRGTLTSVPGAVGPGCATSDTTGLIDFVGGTAGTTALPGAISLRFDQCYNPANRGNLGPASATATVIVDWD